MQHSAFYRFVSIPDPAEIAAQIQAIAQREQLLGSVLLATEGINGTLAGTADALDRAERDFRDTAPLAAFFSGLRFQRSDCQTAPFAKLKVRVRPNIVDIGVPSFATRGGGVAVAPKDWGALIAQDDVVLLDNRNHFEFALGHFQQAQDPGVFHYRDFARYVQENLAHWQRQNKRIAMYCTGGIRCEKTCDWLAEQGVTAYQLDGGILNYLRTQPQTEAWQGQLFVFDNRTALDANLHESTATPDMVYQHPNDAWRLQRARELMRSVDVPES
jgi:UPF0176 protein